MHSQALNLTKFPTLTSNWVRLVRVMVASVGGENKEFIDYYIPPLPTCL
jgi:hypothetical protein